MKITLIKDWYLNGIKKPKGLTFEVTKELAADLKASGHVYSYRPVAQKVKSEFKKEKIVKEKLNIKKEN